MLLTIMEKYLKNQWFFYTRSSSLIFLSKQFFLQFFWPNFISPIITIVMRKIFVLLFSIIATMETFSQNTPTDRQPAVAGTFYSADKETLKKDIAALFEKCKKTSDNRAVRALICPHAGYVFSGEVAASAYSSIPANASFKNIFIISSSHVMAFDGASVYNTGDYITPLGKVMVNREIANELIRKNKVFNFPDRCSY